MNTVNTVNTGTATLLGHVEYEAKKLDGTTEKVQVKQLRIWQFPTYLDALDREPDMVELLCDKPKGWAKTLTDESFEQLVNIGEEVNADFFPRWVRRRAARTEMLMPGLSEKIAAAASNSTTTSQNSQSKQVSPSPAR